MSRSRFGADGLNPNISATCSCCGFSGKWKDVANHSCKKKEPLPPKEIKQENKEKIEVEKPEQPAIIKWVLKFPGEKLIRNNEMIRSHWSRRHKEKKHWMKQIEPFSHIWGEASWKTKIIYIREYGKRAREMDKVNLTHGFKQIEDAIKDLKMIVDDKPENLESEYQQQKSDKFAIVIYMERLVQK